MAGGWPVAILGFALSIGGAVVLSGAEARLEDLGENERHAVGGSLSG